MEDRVRELERKIAVDEAKRKSNQRWFFVFAGVVLAWLGVTTFYQIPRTVDTWLEDEGVKAATERITELKDQAESDAKYLSSLAYSDCREVVGECGNEMYMKPTTHFDRVRFSCPDSRPVVKAFKFERCGEIKTPNEGLRISAQCCGIAGNGG